MLTGMTAKHNNGRPLDEKYDGARQMYDSGLSIQECADYYGVTRQSMWRSLRARGTRFRAKAPTGSANNLYRGGPRHSKRVGRIVEQAIKKGIIQPEPCSTCGKRAEAHHDDYNKPLQIRWLCRLHHIAWHRRHKAIPLRARREDKKP